MIIEGDTEKEENITFMAEWVIKFKFLSRHKCDL